MRKFISFLVLASALSSCLSVGKIERNCDKFAKLCVAEREKVIEYRDTTIYVEKEIEVPVPYYKDSLRIRDSVRVITVVDPVTKKETHLAQMDTTYKEFGMIGGRAWVNDSKVGFDAWLTDSTLLYKYQDWIKVVNGIKESKEKQLVPVKYIPGFYKFTFWFFIAAVVAGAFIVFRVVTGLKGIIKDF